LRACASAGTSSGGVFDLAQLRERIAKLDEQSSDPDLWNDRERAEQLLREKRGAEREVARYDALIGALDDAEVLIELAAEADDEATRAEALEKLRTAERDLDTAELERLLGGEHDAGPAIVSINAGAGGTDACDWAEMLLRMYLRWAERRGFSAELVELLEGEEAGIKRATFTLDGRFAYGLISTEKGVHRLVRISPFDASRRRHTSFASVDVVPALAEDDVPEIDPKELRIDTYRSSGAGGQHVNVTDSAVRITHVPTGIQVAVQNERSQIQNRAVAMKILAARLAERAQEERLKELEEIRGEQMEIGFGSQIRSYVLAPYQLVKDHRTDLEVGNVDAVLDGEIDEFITAELRRRASRGVRIRP